MIEWRRLAPAFSHSTIQPLPYVRNVFFEVRMVATTLRRLIPAKLPSKILEEVGLIPTTMTRKILEEIIRCKSPSFFIMSRGARCKKIRMLPPFPFFIKRLLGRIASRLEMQQFHTLTCKKPCFPSKSSRFPPAPKWLSLIRDRASPLFACVFIEHLRVVLLARISLPL